jgi:ribose transport system permease protein
MAVVVIGRGIDISMVAVLAVPAGLMLQLAQEGYPLSMALLAAVVIALVFGLINGWLIAFAEIPSLFTTLASGLFLAGLGQVAFFRLDVVQWSTSLDPISWMGRGTLLGVPMPVIMFAVVAVLVAFFLKKTRLGAFVYAVGDNPIGARTTGIPTRPLIVLQYVIAALIGAFAGMVMAASVNSMPTRIFNSTLIYDVILVVVLGGIGLSGGRGGVINVIIGTALIGTLLNGMTILDISYSAQNLIKGIILLVAILIDSFLNPRNEETAQQGDI